MKFPVAKFLCQPCLSLGLVLSTAAAVEPLGWSLLPAVQVDATGIHLDQIVAGATVDTPHIRLASAPVANCSEKIRQLSLALVVSLAAG